MKKSLKNGPGHSLLHPSSAITREAFYICDTLSEERVFGNDTKFLYHSYFILYDIQNVDEFLYIRRLHPNTLTTAFATKLGSFQRNNLVSQFVTDFNLVKSGQLELQKSSLKYEKTLFNYSVSKL